jgi:hypothetical protein
LGYSARQYGTQREVIIHPTEEGDGMSRRVRATLATVLGVGLTLGASVAPAAARITGKESVKGVIVASGESGTRTVVSSMIVARGVFTGVGRIVEVENRPGDPENVSRDDIVFARGTIHIRSTNQSFKVLSLNPQTCALRVRIKQTTKVEGGTAKFSHASGSFAGTINGWGVAARNPDGTCSQQLTAVLEVDVLSTRGTLSI